MAFELGCLVRCLGLRMDGSALSFQRRNACRKVRVSPWHVDSRHGRAGFSSIVLWTRLLSPLSYHDLACQAWSLKSMQAILSGDGWKNANGSDRAMPSWNDCSIVISQAERS